MNMKQTTEALKNSGYSVKRGFYKRTIEAKGVDHYISVHFGKRTKTGKQAEKAVVNLVPCLDNKQDGKRAKEHRICKLLSEYIFHGVKVQEIGVATTCFFNGRIYKEV